MISQVSLDSIGKYLPPINLLGGADAKTKKTALIFFASITYAIGVLALCAHAGPILLIAIPSFASAGLLTWAVSRVKSYSSLTTIHEYRKEAENLPLEEIIREHGWDNTIRYQIIDLATFPDKFRAAAQTKSLLDVISLFQEAESCRKKYNLVLKIPPPKEFRSKWANEVLGKSALWIFDNSNMELLNKYEIIERSFYDEFQNYKTLKEGKNVALKNAESTYHQSKDEALKDFEICRIGLGKTPTEIEMKHRYKGEMSYLQSARPDEWYSTPLALFTGLDEPQDEAIEVNILEGRKALHASLIHAKEKLDIEVKKISENFESHCKEINERWKK